LDVSIYRGCGTGCFYCRDNLECRASRYKVNDADSTEILLNDIARAIRNEYSAVGYFLREKYPIHFSYATDPFMPEEKKYRASLRFLKWATEADHPLRFVTQCGILAEPEEQERYFPFFRHGRDSFYISIATLDEKLTAVIEPNSPSPSARLKIIERLTGKGVPVGVACAPYVPDWTPDKDAYCRALADAGARGVWLQYLQFTPRLRKMLPAAWEKYATGARRSEPFGEAFEEYREWQAAAAGHGLVFYAGPYADAWLGYLSPLGGLLKREDFGPDAKLFTYFRDFMQKVTEASFGKNGALTANMTFRRGKRVVVHWSDAEQYLREAGLDNPEFDTQDFWRTYTYWRRGTDRQEWLDTLGRRAPFYEILRYFWNHPHENSQLCWDNPLMQVLKDSEANAWVADVKGDIIAIFNPVERMKPQPSESCEHDYFIWNKDKFIFLGERRI
jgi:DNA repair photolyase